MQNFYVYHIIHVTVIFLKTLQDDVKPKKWQLFEHWPTLKSQKMYHYVILHSNKPLYMWILFFESVSIKLQTEWFKVPNSTRWNI
jgi:hypothetical protein